MGPLVWALCALVANPTPPSPPGGLWLTLEVQNPPSLGGHRILHLEDLIGPDRLSLPGLPQPSAVLLFTTTAEECTRAQGLCARLEEETRALRARGALVAAVVLTARERVPIVRKSMAALKTPIVLALDPHHHVERALGLRGPGGFVVLDSSGSAKRVGMARRLRGGVPAGRDLARVVEELSFALARLEEGDE